MASITVSVILPKTKWANRKWLDEIARTQRQTSVPRLKKLFQKTVFGWSNKPSFGWVQRRSGDEMSITMYPSGQYADIWNLVNTGSPAHTIRPKHGFLVFRPGYRSATRPGSLQSQRAYRSGKEVRNVRSVNHPGFEARKFTDLIAEEYHNPFMNDMQDAFNKVART